jgi:hypothetical protein
MLVAPGSLYLMMLEFVTTGPAAAANTHSQQFDCVCCFAGNMLVAPGSLYLIDWEFDTTGPLAFDLSCLLGNLSACVELQAPWQQHLAASKHWTTGHLPP